MLMLKLGYEKQADGKCNTYLLRTAHTPHIYDMKRIALEPQADEEEAHGYLRDMATMLDMMQDCNGGWVKCI